MDLPIGPGNQLFVHASESLCKAYDKWYRKYGHERACERFNQHNRAWMGMLQQRVDAGHEIDLPERAMVAAIHYVSLLIEAGEL